MKRALLLVASLLLTSCSTVVAAQPRMDTDVAGRALSLTQAPVQSVLDSAVDVGASVSPSKSALASSAPAGASYIARPLERTLTVRVEPDGASLDVLPRFDPRGAATALAIVGEPGRDWTQVQLAVRPNFTTGWVATGDITVTWTTLRIVVDLQQQRLTLFNGNVEITHGTVAIGKVGTPTPTGLTFVSEVLASTDPDDLYGPFALGLAMFSDTVSEYAGGNGQIGIHGTNSPQLLGQAVSHGCVRAHNDLIRDLAGRVPLGTPVEIR